MQLKYLIPLMLLCVLPGFFSGSDAWYASHVSLILRELIAAFLIYRLFINVLSLIWLASCTWDALLLPLWLWTPETLSTVNWFLWPLLLYVALWHTYRTQPVTIDRSATYVAFGRVKSVQGLLIASLTLCGGSSAIVTNGLIYSYKNGALQRRAFYSSRGYVIIRISHKSTVHKLNDIVGTEWTWGSNCLTLILKVILWTR